MLSYGEMLTAADNQRSSHCHAGTAVEIFLPRWFGMHVERVTDSQIFQDQIRPIDDGSNLKSVATPVGITVGTEKRQGSTGTVKKLTTY